jgi:hypothetical protein
VSEIQSLTSQVSELAQSVALWNKAIIVMMIIAAIAAAGLVITQYRAFKQAQRLAEMEAELIRAKDRDKDIKISEASSKASIADQHAEEANKHAYELAVNAEELKRSNIVMSIELEKERKERLELEARVVWRKIPEDQQTRLSLRLRQFHDMEARLVFMAGDLEGQYFASDIAAMLHKAGWFVPIKPGSVMEFANFGDNYTPGEQVKKIGLEIDSSTHEISRKSAEAIMHELNAVGFDAIYSGVKRKFDPNVRPIVYITVYSKPEHAQGEAKIRQQKTLK